MGWPFSVWCLALTGIIFVLQLVPYTGIFLMFMMAPFWSVVTVNIAMIAMIGEALTGRLARAALAIPALYFGGYIAAASASHLELWWLRAEIAAANAPVKVAFEPFRDALVLSGPEAKNLSSGFVRGYAIPVVYEANTNFPTAAHLSRRVSGPTGCAQVRSMRNGAAAGVFAAGFHDKGRFVEGRCEIQQPEDPVGPAYKVDAISSKRDEILLPRIELSISIHPPDGGRVKLRAGYAAPLKWLPMPAMGCGLNSGAAKWQCFASFLRDGFTPLVVDPGEPAVSVVARAIGLVRSPASSRPLSDDDDRVAIRKMVDFERAQLNDEMTRFRALLSDATRWQSGYEFLRFPLLEARPELIAGYASQMLNALRQTIEGAHKTRDARLVLARMIALLPSDAYRPLIPALIEIVRSNPNQEQNNLRNDAELFMMRLGDAGRLATDVFLDMARQPGWRRYWSLIALCRSGNEVGPEAGADVVELLRTTGRSGSDSQLHSAAYVTLLRMGLANEARADPAARNSPEDPWYAEKLVSVKPSSPRSTCTTRDGAPRQLPD